MKKIKALFSTPKKAILTTLCALLLVAGAGTGSVYAVSTIAENSSIGGEVAKNFACADAGVDPVAIQTLKTEFDYEQGQFVYEIEFIVNDIKYEYWVRASDGAIVKKESEALIPAAQGTPGTTSAQIDAEQAKEIALLDAGLTTSQVTFTKVETDTQDGVAVYEIEFYTADARYAYEINLHTKAIYSKSKEILPTQATPNTGGTSVAEKPSVEPTTAVQATAPAQQQSSTAQRISLEEAKKKALADAGVTAAQATFTTAKLDYDDGVLVYELDFYTSTTEYDYEIHAKTGAILSKEVEPLQSSGKPAQSTGSTYIGVDKAKSIAIAHAGFSAAEVSFSKAKLEADDGVKVYEVEFYKDGVEYEYTIHAVSGAIVDYEAERAD